MAASAETLNTELQIIEDSASAETETLNAELQIIKDSAASAETLNDETLKAELQIIKDLASAATLDSELRKILEDEWTIVKPRRNNQNRNFPKLKPIKLQESQTLWVPTDLDTTPEKEQKLMQKMQISIEKLEKSPFFREFLDQIHSPKASECLRKITQSGHKLKMVIYGIGSIESYESPRSQLSLAILMQRNLDWIGDMEVFDPVISLTETKVLEQLGVHVLNVNEQGRREAVDPIFFFMPHCEAEMYENLLTTNWRCDKLNQIVLLGNSFGDYEIQSLMFRNPALDDIRKHILAVLPFTKEFEIPEVSEDYMRPFNGSSWHFFNIDSDAKLQFK